MYYNRERVRNASVDFANLLVIPNTLDDYINNGTQIERTATGKEAYCFHGDLYFNDEDYLCPACGVKTHINQTFHVQLRHVPIGSRMSFVMVDKHQFLCPRCGKTLMQKIPFQAEHHRITVELRVFAEELLQLGLTNKEVSTLTGLHQAVVKEIDKAKLEKAFTFLDSNGVRHLNKPERQAKYLAIDEIKIHKGHKFATVILDLETGHIVWIQGGKKKQVVYDFIDHVGLDWMKGVKAVACDMNSNFQEAFEEKCPHLSIVFDHFHIVKNFNDKVVSGVRKDEQRRLVEEGQTEAAKAFKRSKYILMSNRETLKAKDAEAAQGGVFRKGSDLFRTDSVPLKGGREERYDRLIAENELLFTADLVKDMLDAAYRCTSAAEMLDQVCEIIEICWETGNEHFIWFGNLLNNHLPGIVSHAYVPVSSGKIEGVNRKISVIRDQAFGFPDDEYFFLKLMESSRQPYVRNPKSHMVLH